MACMIKGESVILYDRVQAGIDDFNQPVYEEQPVAVENVLICPVNTGDVTGGNQLYGKKAVYELCIPKDDTHDWQDKRVEFYGQMWRVSGFSQRWMETSVPLDWNMRIRVECYG